MNKCQKFYKIEEIVSRVQSFSDQAEMLNKFLRESDRSREWLTFLPWNHTKERKSVQIEKRGDPLTPTYLSLAYWLCWTYYYPNKNNVFSNKCPGPMYPWPSSTNTFSSSHPPIPRRRFFLFIPLFYFILFLKKKIFEIQFKVVESLF